MKQCQNCKAALSAEDVFCKVCGTKYDGNKQPKIQESLFLKYSSYLDDDALFNVAWAKEQGIVKSEDPNEAEQIYKSLAYKGHLNGMFRYAMMLLNHGGSDNIEQAKIWLKNASRQGHTESTNYLMTAMPNVLDEDKPVKIVEVKKGTSYKGELSGEEVYTKMQSSVIEIYASNAKKSSRSSGFLVSSTGFAITNAHAVISSGGDLYSKIEVCYNSKYYQARVVAVGAPADGKTDSVDLALLFIVGLKDCGFAELGESSLCRNGQKVYLIGNSLGDGTCITSGIISDAKRYMPGLSYPYIMTDAAANHGNSGGPLVDEMGSVIGVLVAGIQNAEGMNYAIPIDVVKEFLSYVASSMALPQRVLGEMCSIKPSNMSAKDKIFQGIHLVVDIVAFILSLF